MTQRLAPLTARLVTRCGVIQRVNERFGLIYWVQINVNLSPVAIFRQVNFDGNRKIISTEPDEWLYVSVKNVCQLIFVVNAKCCAMSSVINYISGIDLVYH